MKIKANYAQTIDIGTLKMKQYPEKPGPDVFFFLMCFGE